MSSGWILTIHSRRSFPSCDHGVSRRLSAGVRMGPTTGVDGASEVRAAHLRDQGENGGERGGPAEDVIGQEDDNAARGVDDVARVRGQQGLALAAVLQVVDAPHEHDGRVEAAFEHARHETGQSVQMIRVDLRGEPERESRQPRDQAKKKRPRETEPAYIR